MKKASVIVAVVAGYCLFESVALFSTLYPYHREVPIYILPPPLVALYWAQVLLIPGMGIVFGRVIYGAYRWRTRAIMAFMIWFGSISGFLIALLVVGVLLSGIFTRSKFLFILALPSAIGGCVFALLPLIRKVRKRTIEINAACWLAERESGTQSRERQRRNFGVLVASWIPIATVTVVFVFFFEIWGVVLHLSNPRMGDLPGYRVPVPITWTANSSEFETEKGRSYLFGWMLERVGSGLLHYPLPEISASIWSVSTGPYERVDQPGSYGSQDASKVIGTHEVKIGDEALSCVEERWRPFFETRDMLQARFVSVDCRGTGRLSVDFGGLKSDLPRFYKMLEGTVREK